MVSKFNVVPPKSNQVRAQNHDSWETAWLGAASSRFREIIKALNKTAQSSDKDRALIKSL